MSILALEGDYISVLKSELARRTKRNPSYSLRAFARDIGMAPSSLSEVMKGSTGLSQGSAAKIADRLKYRPEDKAVFCDMVASVHGRSKGARGVALARLNSRRIDPEIRLLNKDTFEFISDWYHPAILALMECPTFKSDDEWIAKKLGISTADAKAAMKRLQRLQFVESVDGVYSLRQHRTLTPSGTSPEAMRMYHRDLMQKAMDSMCGQPSSDREISATVLPIEKEYIDEGRAMIAEFRKQFSERFKTTAANEVYALTIQFHRLTETP